MKQLALVIDLNVCVGCHACVTSCKQWNTSGEAGYLSDDRPYGADPTGTFFNRVQTFEVGEYPKTETVHFPKSCLHCEDPPCVPVCPTGASYKRAEDGIVPVDYDKCIGCKYCARACPYGAREIDEHQKVMKKCTLCVDRIYDQKLPEAERKPACVLACPTSARLFGDIHDPDTLVSRAIRENGGYALMPEWGTHPANHYLPRRKTVTEIHPDELTRQDNPLKVDGLLPRPATGEPALGHVTRLAALARNARLRSKSTLATAIGVKHPKIVQIAQGAMGGSFNPREFFHGRPREVVRAVRWTFLALGFPLPALMLFAAGNPAWASGAAFLVQCAGLLAERWYFFAEAKHPQNLYYQAIS